MAASNRELGRGGESIAAAFLERNGMKIVARNVHLRYAEIDLVALHEGVLCIVEVKRRRSNRFGTAAEAVDQPKRRRIIKATRELLARHTMPRHHRVRFDVVAIGPDGIQHYPGAFDADAR